MPPIDPDRQWVSTQGVLVRSGSLGMDMQVGFAGVATVPEPGEWAAGVEGGSRAHLNAAALQVGEHDPDSIAVEDQVVPGQVDPVPLWYRKVGERIDGAENGAVAGRGDRLAKSGVCSRI